MELTMNRTLLIIAALLVSLPAFSQDPAEQQQSSLDQLLNQYDEQRTASTTRQDPQAEIRKLRNQVIDLRVERDELSEENTYLKKKIESFESSQPACTQECVSLDKIENQRIVSYVIYSLSLYRMAEVVIQNTPADNVEAHKKAQRVMAGVKSDLDVLGYDTTDMTDYPTLEELMKEFQVVQNRMTR